MAIRWYGAVAGVAAALAGTALADPPMKMIVRTVTPVRTASLRDMRNFDLPTVMRAIVGNRYHTQQQLDLLRGRLMRSGSIAPAGGKYLIPLGRITPAMAQAPQVHDPVIQTKLAPSLPNDGILPGVSFPGIGVSDNPADQIGCSPPDTNAAVGSGYVVEIVNLCDGDGVGYFKVWDTGGNTVLGVTSLSELWALGSGCNPGYGDNQVMYDQIADRWILTQANFLFTGICAAVSATSDPTGTYYLYDFVIDPTGFADYPKMGKWPVGEPDRDAYFVTDNDFTGGDVYVNFTALERDQMLLGNPAQEIVINGAGNNGGGLDYSALPADLDGSTLPPLGDPGIFVNYTSPWLFGDGTPYALAVWRMRVNWAAPSARLVGPQMISVYPFNDGICNFDLECIPQPNPATPGDYLDAFGDRLMFRLAYRNDLTHNVQILSANQTVGTGSPPSGPPAGIRWYTLVRKPATSLLSPDYVWQQGTYLPQDHNSRWMGSIAMDHRGNIGLGFSESGPSLGPSAAYAGETSAGVLARANVMNAGETVFAAGSGVQHGTGNRWGDYSSTVLDPADDCTFWTAQEYISDTGVSHWSTAIGSFRFANCSP